MAADPACAAPLFRTGDTVLHGPTGETWVVAYANPVTGRLAWLGWPNGEAQIQDCTLVQAATDEEHQRWLWDMRRSGGRRWTVALRLYGDPGPDTRVAASAIADLSSEETSDE